MVPISSPSRAPRPRHSSPSVAPTMGTAHHWQFSHREKSIGNHHKAVKAGVCSGRACSTNTAWSICESYASSLGFEPFLKATTDKVSVVQVFAQQIQSGTLAPNGNPVRARSAEDYERFVAQTFLCLGGQDPHLVNLDGKMDFGIT